MPCPPRRITVRRHRQAQIAPQRIRFVLDAEQAAGLQNRHDLVDEVLQRVRDAAADHEAVRSAALEPFLHPVRHLLGRSDEERTRRRHLQSGLAQRQSLLPGRLLDAVGRALEAVLAEIPQLGERRIGIVLREVVMLEEAAQIEQRVLGRDKRRRLPVFALGLLLRFPDDRSDARKNEHVVGIAAEGGRTALDVRIEGRCLLQRFMSGEDRVGFLGRIIAPHLGRSGLEDDGMPLTGARDVERTFDGEELALVIQGMHFVRIEENARLLVAHEGVVLPGIPQAARHLQILRRDAVSLVVIGMLLLAEVGSRALQRRGDNVPARTAVADLVDGGELPRYRERLAVRGGQSADEPNMGAHRCQCAQNRNRLEAVEEMRYRLFIDVKAVRHEHQVELPFLRLAGPFLVQRKIGARIRLDVGMPPQGSAAADAVKHRSQP
ncbi:Putative uncharacterized protein [Paenibacillus sp. P22]|nr:Putative uncharacterized protein [Paenibacillus sp. P22]